MLLPCIEYKVGQGLVLSIIRPWIDIFAKIPC